MFKEFFTEIGPSVTIKIPSSSKPFESFLKKASTILPGRYITINQLKDAFFSIKMNKSTGVDKISFNVIKNCFVELSDILRYFFYLPWKQGYLQILWRLRKWPLYSKLMTLVKLVIIVQFLFCHVSRKN